MLVYQNTGKEHVSLLKALAVQAPAPLKSEWKSVTMSSLTMQIGIYIKGFAKSCIFKEENI